MDVFGKGQFGVGIGRILEGGEALWSYDLGVAHIERIAAQFRDFDDGFAYNGKYRCDFLGAAILG